MCDGDSVTTGAWIRSAGKVGALDPSMYVVHLAGHHACKVSINVNPLARY